jgi:hypothetical protein
MENQKTLAEKLRDAELRFDGPFDFQTKIELKYGSIRKYEIAKHANYRRSMKEMALTEIRDLKKLKNDLKQEPIPSMRKYAELAIKRHTRDLNWAFTEFRKMNKAFWKLYHEEQAELLAGKILANSQTTQIKKAA